MKKSLFKLLSALLCLAVGLSSNVILSSALENPSADIIPTVQGYEMPEEAALGENPDYTPDYENITCVVVSPDGDDETGLGTAAHPFKTLEKARDTARASSAERVVVFLKGSFTLSSPFLLDGQDSGDVYTNYPGSTASVTGGKSYNLSIAQKVTDETILNSLSDQSIANRLYSVNLWNLCPDMKPSDISSMRSPLTFEINADRELSASCYPENGFLTITETTGSYTFKVGDPQNRMASWQALTHLMGDVPFYFGGYPGNDWSYYTAGADIDFSTGVIEDKSKQSHYGINAGQRIFFYNLISEINDYGDYALDKDRNFYFALKENETPQNSTLRLNTYKGNLFEISGSNIHVEGLSFSGVYEGSAIKAQGNGLTLKNCTFSQIQNQTAVSVDGLKNTVAGCCFTGLGSSCLTVSGGSLSSPSENTVFNCEFEEWGRSNRTYQHAVAAYGSGARIAHNKMSKAPHLAVYLEGTNHTIEYNDISHVCRETSDSGAVYTGRSYFNRGNVIRYNLFSDIVRFEGSQSGYCSAVYQDDCGSSFDVYGNIFSNCDRAFLIGGGRENVFEKNILINCGDGEATPYSGDLDARGIIWGNNPADFDSEADKSLLEGELGYYYPEIKGLWNDKEQFCYPKNNTVRDNILLNSDPFRIDSRAVQYGSVGNNIETSDTSLVEDYDGGNFRPVAEKVDLLVEDFPDIEVNNIGPTASSATDEQLFMREVTEVDRMIAALPDVQNADESDKAAIKAAKTAFDRLLASQKTFVSDYDKLHALVLASFGGAGQFFEQKLITDGENISGWSVNDGFSGAIWNVAPPQGDGYFVITGGGNGLATYSFEAMDLEGAKNIKLYVYVVDPDDLSGIRLNSDGGSVWVKGIENYSYSVGGWVEIDPEIDYFTATGGFDIKNVTSITFESNVADGPLALIGYDYIRADIGKTVYIQGDIDMNGSVTVNDALTALQHTVKIITLSEEEKALADMNGDQVVNSIDAMLILRTAVGK